MRIEKLFVSLVLGLGLTLALVWLLGGGRLPVAWADSFTVDVTNDENDGSCAAGDCSLREAIIAANGNGGADAITLGGGTHVLTITGTGEDAAATGDLDITDALTIEGTGPGNTIIDASGVISDRVFDIHSTTGTVVISGVTIMGGNVTGHGGGIYNDGADLILVNTVVSSNVATGTVLAGNGGGVYVRYGNATLSGGEIRGNRASIRGGGVYIGSGHVTLDGAQILGNATQSGGGVYISTGGVALSEGQIFSNTAFDGGGVYVFQGSATLSGGQVLSNTATSAGGGVYIREGSATLSGGQVRGNSAQSGGGVHITSGGVFTQTGGVLAHNNTTTGSGGGVYVSGGRATLSGGQILGNRANFGGGVAVINTNATFNQTGPGVIISNTANVRGGGVYLWQGNATLSGAQVISNTADDGGGLYVSDGMASLALVNTTVSRNAAGGDGGGLYVNDGAVTVTYTTVASNTAATGGGGIHWMSGTIALQNTIVAHNGTTNCVGALTSSGHNLDSGMTCGFAATGDITDTDPLLGPLTDDGGTLVHPLLDDSPAIDGGVCIAGITTDQRGVTRPEGVTCDIGAYEWAWQKVYLPLVLRN